MRTRSIERAASVALRAATMAFAGLALAGCTLGSMFGGTPADTQFQNATATATELQAGAANALPAIATTCPEIKVRPGTEALFFYGTGRVGNPQALNYQAVIEKQSRNCIVSNGQISVKMGVVGRVLLGPSGTQQSVTVPVRFAVERDGVAIFSEKYTIPVALTPPAQSAEFVKVVENVVVPYLGGENIVIWVGFDTKS
jgi:hypothetical protein